MTGRLKFFNEGQNYGFVLSDIDNKDIFFHFDDMKKTNLSKQFLKDAKNRFIVRLQFKVMAYYGKYNLSRKAVDIDLLKIEPLAFQTPTDGITSGTTNMFGSPLPQPYGNLSGMDLAAFTSQLTLQPSSFDMPTPPPVIGANNTGSGSETLASK